MASLHDTTRAERMMTADERRELLAAGWQIEVIDSLHLRGFRPCRPDYVAARFDGTDIARTMGFLRQTAVPHLHITLAKSQSLSEVMESIDTAIYESGHRHGHATLAGLFMRFFEQCKSWQPAPDLAVLEKRLTALEANTKLAG